MEALPEASSPLDLTICIPGSSGSALDSNSANRLVLTGVRGETGFVDLDINQVPDDRGDRQWMTITMNGNSSADLEDLDDDHNSNGGGAAMGPRKKLRLSKDQSRLLEESFRLNHTLNTKQKEALAIQLQLKPRQVEVWFQNRRARSKLKQTEMECEYLKRWFSTLTEQNRWLQKEVEDLRALKVAPPTVLSPETRQPLPASTLSMCPRCERVTASNSVVKPPSPSPPATAATSTGGASPTNNNMLTIATKKHPPAI
ncbi:hypothetical protein V2J09_001624 [Rumex salicifolius]